MSIRTLLRDYRKGILAGMKFAFDEFHTLCQNPNFSAGDDEIVDSNGQTEQGRRQTMEGIAKSLIQQMGGEVCKPGMKYAADYWVYYKRLERRDFPPDQPPVFIPPRYKRIHWLFITECFFSYGRRDLGKFSLNLDPQASLANNSQDTSGSARH